MTKTQLQNFLIIAECKNFSKAAEKLFISQPALSKQIHSLETELDVQLFHRGHHYLTLTPTGEVLVKEAKELFQKEDELIQHVKQAQTLCLDSLNILYTNPIVFTSIPESVSQYNRHYHTACSFNQCDNDNLFSYLASNDADIAFALTNRTLSIDGFDTFEIDCCDVAVAVEKNHPLTAYKRLSAEQLLPYSLIMVDGRDLPLQCSTYEETFTGFPFSKYKKIYARDMDSATAMIRAGVGISLISPNYVPFKDSLDFIPLSTKTSTYITAIWKSDHSEKTHSFLQFLKIHYPI